MQRTEKCIFMHSIVPKSHDSSEESEVEEDNEIEEEEAGSGYPTKSQSVERTYKGIWP